MLSRTRSHVLLAPFKAHNYRTLARSFAAYRRPLRVLYRYVTNRGTYPYTVKVRTPVGTTSVGVPTFHDLRTVNEIFCREDYPVSTDIKVVVDVGANIGISATYFLTRNDEVRVYCFEPSPVNLPRLEAALLNYGDRVKIEPVALSDATGTFEFNAEPVGRYGGLLVEKYRNARAVDHVIEVPAEEISGALDRILKTESMIDVLKIDTEGSEFQILRSIRPDLLPRIREMFVEVNLDEPLFPDYFDQHDRPDGIAHFVLKTRRSPTTA